MTKTQAFGELASGTALLQQRRFAEAIPIFERILRREPKNVGAANLLGLAFMQAGRVEEAVQSIKKGLRADNRQPTAHYNLGVMLQTLGRHEDAVNHYREAIKQNPGDAPSYNNLGIALKKLDQVDKAIIYYREAIKQNENYVEAYANLGFALLSQAKFEEAARVAEKAVSLNSSFMELYLIWGHALCGLSEPLRGLECFDRAIKLQPSRADAYIAAAETMMAIYFEDRAIPLFTRAIALEPQPVSTYFKLATCLYVNQRYDEARRIAETGFAGMAVTAKDEIAKAIYLQFANRNEEAIRYFEKGLELDPTNSAAHAAYGFTLLAIGRYDDAFQQFRNALEKNPEERDAELGQSLAALHLGQFKEGWKGYEKRLQAGCDKVNPEYSEIPRWDGSAITEKLIVWGEQGLGDQILYASILKDIPQRASDVILRVSKRLVGLFQRSFPDMEVHAVIQGHRGAEGAAQISFGGLGEFFRLEWKDFHPEKYLIADEARAVELRQKIRRDEKAVIGLSWSSSNAKLGEHKSARLADFSSLIAAPELTFVNLQYGDTLAEVSAVSRKFGTEIQNVAEVDNTQDIDGLAALIEACDAVLTTSNTTAHIAGALGKRVWIMVPHGQGRLWYWFHNRRDSPWYPGARIVHQQPGQSWADVVGSITPEILEFAVNPRKEE